MKAKVSIIIAAYNIENYIERCLESVVNQTFKELEIVVVNDGSTDNTLERIEKFKSNDERIIIVNQENKGLIEARKSGFKVVNGEYILFIDGDDWLDVKSIEILYKIAKNDNYDIVQYAYYIAYEDSNLIKVGDSNTKTTLLNNQFLEEILKVKISNSIWSKFIRRKFIEENNVLFPSNISYGEDLAFSISLSINKPKVYITNRCLYYYYQRSTSLTKVISPKILEIYDVTMFIKKILIDNNFFIKYIKEFEYMAYIHNYYLIKDLIYLHENKFSKKIFDNWKKLNISMKGNKYYRQLYKKDTLKARVTARICEKNYLCGRFLYKIIFK